MRRIYYLYVLVLTLACTAVLVAGVQAHGAPTPAPAPLTATQQATKNAICLQFNQNVQMPLADIPPALLAANCPWVSA